MLDGFFRVDLLGVRIESFLILPKRMLIVLRRMGLPFRHVLKDRELPGSKCDDTFLVSGKADIVLVRRMTRFIVSS